ncbi:MAG: c-type cytochrome [Actinomycetota bacterium]|nr:c-type cytochrome [Actinomycetota bacterium]
MGVFLFTAFWVVMGLALVVIAISGGPRRARARVQQAAPSLRARRNVLGGLTLVCVAFGAAIPVWVIAAGERSAKAGHADLKLTASERRGRLLFGQTCNQCHTLSASKTVGKVGPNLDNIVGPLSGADAKQTAKNKQSFVLSAIMQGRARGIGRMPAQLLQGQDAEHVAAYVARVAGRQ